MQQGVQTDATCHIQQCLELLANNVASVCTGLNEILHARRIKVSCALWHFHLMVCTQKGSQRLNVLLVSTLTRIFLKSYL